MIESKVFSRTQSDQPIVSGSTYNLVIGLVLFWGFFVNWVMVKQIDPRALIGVNPIVFFIGYFACCFLGIYLFNSSKNPTVSFIGYNLVVLPFGTVINMVVGQYDSALVSEAIQITGTVTVIMMIMGSMFPSFFQAISKVLLIALISVIIVELLQIFVFHTDPAWTDWAVVVIFCGYIGYDWGRANQIPKTIDNAVDSAAAIYMDIINLFLRILRLLARSRR